jgi:hypothetical protein
MDQQAPTLRPRLRDPAQTLPGHHETMVHISMIMVMSRRLARTGDW